MSETETQEPMDPVLWVQSVWKAKLWQRLVRRGQPFPWSALNEVKAENIHEWMKAGWTAEELVATPTPLAVSFMLDTLAGNVLTRARNMSPGDLVGWSQLRQMQQHLERLSEGLPG